MTTFFGRVRCNHVDRDVTLILQHSNSQKYKNKYKKLVLGACKVNFSISANIISQDETQALDVFDSKTSGIRYVEKKYDLEDDLDHELDSLDSTLSEFQDSVIVYIAVTRRCDRLACL